MHHKVADILIILFASVSPIYEELHLHVQANL